MTLQLRGVKEKECNVLIIDCNQKLTTDLSCHIKKKYTCLIH
jgi:hypothetical protein